MSGQELYSPYSVKSGIVKYKIEIAPEFHDLLSVE